MPLWVDPDNIKIGFWNNYHFKKWHNEWPGAKDNKFKGFKDFNWLWAPVLGDMFSEGKIDWRLLQAFDTNNKYFEKQLLKHPLLLDKQSTIKELLIVFKQGKYNVCISTIFPLIDYIVRKLLVTTNLTISIPKICKSFKECGFDYDSINQLMPTIALREYIESITPKKHFQYWKSAEYIEFSKKIQQFNFGIVGVALNSFLKFSNNYYSYYREDIGAINIINRHAILHGSVNLFDNKVNATKLFTYLYLLLELEPVFTILFNEH